MKAILTIEGMSCGHCSQHVTKVLKEIPEVMEVTVNLENKQAMLEAGAIPAEELLKQIIDDAGFDLISVDTQ